MADVETFTTEDATPDRLARIRSLMDAVFEGRFSDDDWAHTVGGWHAAMIDGDDVVAHASVVLRPIEAGGTRFRTGYVEGVAARPDRQGEGLGTAVMSVANDLIRDRFDLGALSTGEHHFYERLGWERWLGATALRIGDGLVHTPDDDDGVMVLRFGASAGLDLKGDISCDDRAGDVW